MDNFNLTLLQFAASRFLIINYQNESDGLIIAVCGAGKTEMCFPLFNQVISNRKTAFAIPRVDICNDIYKRLVDYYGLDKVGIHTGNSQINLSANLLVLTTNQLLKYKSYFNLIIIDEVDAFPFDNDPTFYNGVPNSLQVGSIFYLTSTPSARIQKLQLPTFTIYKRWHNYPLPVPKLIHHTHFLKLNRKQLQIITKRNRNLLIFIATIRKAKQFSTYLQTLEIAHELTYSSHPKRSTIINDFKQNKIEILLTTTILERGVTFKDIDVIIIDSDDSFYNIAALVQISGRVNRNINFQQGQVYFFYSHYTKQIKQSIKFIKQNNRKI